MRRPATRAVSLLVGVLLSRPDNGQAAESPELPVHAADTGTPTAYKPIRYLESYAHLANAPRLEGWDRIKYVGLWPGGYVSFGGQHRLRYELLDPIDLGVAPERSTSSVLLSRNLVHADLHVVPGIRVFGQLGGFYALGIPSSQAEPPEADDVDVTQLFIESSASLGNVQIVTRAGRQEMSLGSTRWVSTRDGTNVRQAFDLVRTTISKPGAWTVEAFFGTTPDLRRGAFDDAPEWRDGFWGSYATIPVLPKKLLNVEAFYLARRRHDAEYAAVTGREVRHTFGLRAFGETSFGLEYIEHAMVQLGSIDESSVLAWALSSTLWQRLPKTVPPIKLGVRTDALSGDSRPNDGRVTTFHPLFPNQTFFSALPAIYPTNLYAVHPLLRLETEKVTLEGGCIFFWRQAVEDSIYQPPGVPLISADATRARYTGAQSSLSLAYKASSSPSTTQRST
ncbi:MAG: hypothetical protein K0S65_5281 [Labilithrix sp.]|nr:hypothetical protein [Labilithrix sp.]